MDFKSEKSGKKSFRERLLDLCGYEIWPLSASFWFRFLVLESPFYSRMTGK